MKIGNFLFVLFISQLLLAQTEDRFDAASFNQKYLEHLVKLRVDAVRAKYDCEPLVNDSILYVASDHHARYMTRKGRLTHTESDSIQTKTPQLRAEYFGAKNYRVGENVLYTPYNSTVKNKKGQKFKTNTYQGIADAMVDSWVNSPGHFKNIITKEYQITGLSVSIDKAKGRIYACQKFAIVDFKFSFEENKEFFSYSEYLAPPIVSSFEGISNELIDYKYPFKLRHDKPEKCETCLSLEPEKPYITLRVERNKFILKVENSDYVRKMIRDKKDGFAVEIVTYNDYMCGNPAYYTNPSRRNEQLKLNGFTLEPLYREALFKGYKKRKKKKDVRFLSYIFRKDSVSFFRRFGQYKADRYDSKYFEISLGKVPKDIGFWNHNLVYIQNNQICDIDYFTSYCGELFSEYRESDFIPLDSEGSHDFLPQKDASDFTIPFEQGQVTFTNDDIEPFLTKMGKMRFSIDSIEIQAYASIEGNTTTNERLQLQRGQNIANLIQSRQTEKIKLSVETSTDWDGFYANAAKSNRWKSLKSKSKEEIQELLKLTDQTELEPLLAPTRRGDIRIYSTIPVVDQNLAYLINKENTNIIARIKQDKTLEQKTERVKEFENLYAYAHHLVVMDSLPAEFLAKFTIPEEIHYSHRALEQFSLYSFEFDEAFSLHDPSWDKRKYRDMVWLFKNCGDHNHFSPQFLYQFARLKTEKFKKNPPVKQEEVQEVLDILAKLNNAYEIDSAFNKNIDQVNFDLNVMLLNKIYPFNPLESSKDASKSIAQLWGFYRKYDEMTDSKAIALAKCAVQYSGIQQASNMLQPYATTDSILAYSMPLSWNHSSETEWTDYYTRLVDLSYSMNSDTWCNMFMNECQIPFQAFDHEALRNRFCEECMERNKVILKLKGSSD